MKHLKSFNESKYDNTIRRDIHPKLVPYYDVLNAVPRLFNLSIHFSKNVNCFENMLKIVPAKINHQTYRIPDTIILGVDDEDLEILYWKNVYTTDTPTDSIESVVQLANLVLKDFERYDVLIFWNMIYEKFTEYFIQCPNDILKELGKEKIANIKNIGLLESAVDLANMHPKLVPYYNIIKTVPELFDINLFLDTDNNYKGLVMQFLSKKLIEPEPEIEFENGRPVRKSSYSSHAGEISNHEIGVTNDKYEEVLYLWRNNGHDEEITDVATFIDYAINGFDYKDQILFWDKLTKAYPEYLSICPAKMLIHIGKNKLADAKKIGMFENFTIKSLDERLIPYYELIQCVIKDTKILKNLQLSKKFDRYMFTFDENRSYVLHFLNIQPEDNGFQKIVKSVKRLFTYEETMTFECGIGADNNFYLNISNFNSIKFDSVPEFILDLSRMMTTPVIGSDNTIALQQHCYLEFWRSLLKHDTSYVTECPKEILTQTGFNKIAPLKDVGLLEQMSTLNVFGEYLMITKELPKEIDKDGFFSENFLHPGTLLKSFTEDEEKDTVILAANQTRNKNYWIVGIENDENELYYLSIHEIELGILTADGSDVGYRVSIECTSGEEEFKISGYNNSNFSDLKQAVQIVENDLGLKPASDQLKSISKIGLL